MGGNSSSLIADLSVGWDEYKFMTKLIAEKKFGLCKLLSNNTRYIDDLLCLNYLNFHNLINRIYPDSLEMVRSGSDNKNINYLDTNINMPHEGLKISLYNKTKEFNFDVVSFTFPHSNIPNELGYIPLTKTTAAQNEVALSYHRVRGLYFPAVVFVRSIVFFTGS